MTVATSVTAPPTRYTRRALNASFPNPDRIRTVACGAGEPFGGACMSPSASSYASVAAKGALPSPLARPFRVYARMLSSISRYTGGFSTVQSQADSAAPVPRRAAATLVLPLGPLRRAPRGLRRVRTGRGGVTRIGVRPCGAPARGGGAPRMAVPTLMAIRGAGARVAASGAAGARYGIAAGKTRSGGAPWTAAGGGTAGADRMPAARGAARPGRANRRQVGPRRPVLLTAPRTARHGRRRR